MQIERSMTVKELMEILSGLPEHCKNYNLLFYSDELNKDVPVCDLTIESQYGRVVLE